MNMQISPASTHTHTSSESYAVTFTVVNAAQ